ASDALFVAIAAGKTTATELSQKLGEVAPTAQAAGISFQELTGAIAALTLQGIKTPQAVTGLNAMISNIAKPSKDAATEAKRLGIEWNLTALKGMGLQKFLAQLAGNTKVNVESFPKLFGSIDGIKAAFALTAQGGAKFNAVMEQMQSATGATKKAFDIMSETSGFQAQRFAAVKENAMVLIGQALEPMAVAAMKVANRIIGAFNSLPEFWRDLLVKVVAGVVVFATVAAAVVGAIAGAMAFAAQLKAVAAAVAGASNVLLPLIAVVVAVGLAFAALRIAVENDLGGLGSMLGGWVADAKLAFEALGQLFSEGAISGPVMEDITKAENEGVLNFVTQIYLAVNRIKNFLSGIGDGFEAGVKKLEPVFANFRAALEGLAAEFGGLSQAVDPTAAGEAFDEWGSKGKSVGDTIAQVAGLVVSALAAIIDIVTGVVQMWDDFKEAVAPIGALIAEIGSEISSVIAEVSGMSDAGDTFVTVGNVIGAVFSLVAGIVAAVFTEISGKIRALVNVFGGVVQMIKGIFTGDWALVWHGFKRVVYGAVIFVVGMLASVLQVVGAVVDAVGKVAGVDLGVNKMIANARASIEATVKGGLGLDEPMDAKKAEVAPGPPVVAAPAAEAEMFGTVASVEAANRDAELLGTVESLNAAIRDKKPEPQQVTVNVMLPDGQVLASGVSTAQADNANRSYVTTNP
ncbi:MAG: phage tail tape measure protein, partial [Rhodocyclaceae bacterium]